MKDFGKHPLLELAEWINTNKLCIITSVTSGKCRKCPADCDDGCNALFDGALSCGRKNTFDHVAEIALCALGVPELEGCAGEFANVIKE